jgi:tetratricopeptide (TPR) repeat protein
MMQMKYVGPVVVAALSEPAKVGGLAGDYVVLEKVAGEFHSYRLATRYSALYEGYRLAEADPGSADAHFMLASAWLAAGKKGLAAGHLKLLAAREKLTERALVLRANLALELGDWPALEATLADGAGAKVFGPREISDYYYKAGMKLRALASHAEAIAMLRKAEAQSPTSAPVLRSLATLCLATNRRDEARTYYARLVELFPDANDINDLRNIQRSLAEKNGDDK